MIERWFPCREVSEASKGGWGSGNSEASLFPWFARRPLAQAKAAVVCALLDWPVDPRERATLQALVRRCLVGRGDGHAGYDEAHEELLEELARQYSDTARLLDPFAGRGMIPVEAARLGVLAWGIDNSPVATLGASLLIDYPMRDWSAELDLPYDDYIGNPIAQRLLYDIEFLINLVGHRLEQDLDEFYPRVNGRRPWGYLWAATLPCQECGRRFPVVGSLLLRNQLTKSGDEGQSFRLIPNSSTGEVVVEIHAGAPMGSPTLVTPPGQSKHSSNGKVAICPFCAHSHAKSLCERLAQAGVTEDALLLVADLDDGVGKAFRLPTPAEYNALGLARKALGEEPPFALGLPARPTEPIPAGNTWTIQPAVFGAKTYGDLCNDRQTLALVRLARTIDDVGTELIRGGVSDDYAAALTAYLAAGLARKLRRSTRGCTLEARIDPKSNRVGVHDIFGSSESSISFSWDYFESGPGHGPGTWRSVAGDTIPVLRNQMRRKPGRPGTAQRGSAVSLPFPDGFFSAVVTDPPYDNMIDYADASDLFFVWMKRALTSTHPWFALTPDPNDLQDKSEEIIVKKGGAGSGDHRTETFYDSMLTRAFAEAKRAVSDDGVVTIVFGHGDPDVWHRLLGAVKAAGLVLTGSWPAQTEGAVRRARPTSSQP
jgi:adenine-specific DNA methylase